MTELTSFPIPASFAFLYEDEQDGSRYWVNRSQHVLLAFHPKGDERFTLDDCDRNGVGFQDARSRVGEGATWDELVSNTLASNPEGRSREWLEAIFS